MIKLLAIFAVLHVSGCHGFQQFLDDKKNINTAAGLQCSKLDGTSRDCLACYPCNHESIRDVSPRELQYLTLSYSNCTRGKLCCLKTEGFKARSTDDNCGKHNPLGYPPNKRAGLRSVLEREYPWRAWVYSSITNQPLCAATYVFFNVFALVTTASCVEGHQPRDLYVKFTKTQKTPDLVKNVVLNENYHKAAGGNIDDIAVLSLMNKPDPNVAPVCIDNNPAVHGSSSCVVVSDSETFVNTIVPQLKKCEADDVKSGNNVLCSYLVEGDYEPQLGAGLYCVEGHANATDPRYALYGIYQSKIKEKQIALYSSVHKFTNWILRTTNAIKKANQQKHP